MLTFLLVLVVHIDARVIEGRDVDISRLLIGSILLAFAFSFDGLVSLCSLGVGIFTVIIRIIDNSQLLFVSVIKICSSCRFEILGDPSGIIDAALIALIDQLSLGPLMALGSGLSHRLLLMLLRLRRQICIWLSHGLVQAGCVHTRRLLLLLLMRLFLHILIHCKVRLALGFVFQI